VQYFIAAMHLYELKLREDFSPFSDSGTCSVEDRFKGDPSSSVTESINSGMHFLNEAPIPMLFFLISGRPIVKQASDQGSRLEYPRMTS